MEDASAERLVCQSKTPFFSQEFNLCYFRFLDRCNVMLMHPLLLAKQMIRVQNNRCHFQPRIRRSKIRRAPMTKDRGHLSTGIPGSLEANSSIFAIYVVVLLHWHHSVLQNPTIRARTCLPGAQARLFILARTRDYCRAKLPRKVGVYLLVTTLGVDQGRIFY